MANLASPQVLGEEESELVTLHGIRWRESSWRSTINLISTWRARCTDLLEEASLEVRSWRKYK